jgi:hypothetical protein
MFSAFMVMGLMGAGMVCVVQHRSPVALGLVVLLHCRACWMWARVVGQHVWALRGWYQECLAEARMRL